MINIYHEVDNINNEVESNKPVREGAQVADICGGLCWSSVAK